MADSRETAPPPSAGSGPQRERSCCSSIPWLLRPILSALLLSLGLMLLCYAAAGPTLGLYFGGIATALLLAPPLVLADVEWKCRGLAAGALLTGIAAIWLIPTVQGTISLGQWLGAVAVLATWLLAVGSFAAALHRWRLPPAAASALTIFTGLAWLSWPVWLAPWLTMDWREQLVNKLVAAHPLFALNGLLLSVFPVPWPQYKLAYLLTNIGDDIPYSLPSSVMPSILIHALFAAAWLLLSMRRPMR